MSEFGAHISKNAPQNIYYHYCFGWGSTKVPQFVYEFTVLIISI